MGRKRMSGLTLRGGIWHINKKIDGQRIYESTGTSDWEEAQKHLVHKLEIIRQAKVYGVRPKRTFREAVVKYVNENAHKDSLKDEIYAIKTVDPYIGNLTLETIHTGSLQSFIAARRKEGVKSRTINYGLQMVRHILNVAASEWLDEHGLTWLTTAPKIKLLAEHDKSKPYPLNWDEQEKLFNELPAHLKAMALFAVNTGCRDKEVCRLRWDWEIKIPGIDCSVFMIPGINSELKVKNRDDRLVVLNRIAKSVIDDVRGLHSDYVFTYHSKPISRMLNSAWKKARLRASLPRVRVHDLKHTFGRRLRAAGVSFEDRQDLLGHRSGRITTHYSAAELSNLIQAANKACEGRSGPLLTLLKTPTFEASRVKVA